MEIEEKIFQKCTPDIEKLIDFGFKKSKNGYIYEKIFNNDTLKAIIKISSGKIEGKIFDLESNDEFLPFRIKNKQGEYIGQVREEYEAILKDIKQNCYIEKYFIYPQSNRITKKIADKYGNYPEFLWEKSKGSGIFRNPDTRKWYLAILDVDESKLNPKKKGIIEVANVKLNPDKITALLKKENYYPAYHMNKKSWITIILNDTIQDETIMDLIEESYNYSKKK